jgi:hypothetical protein
MSNPYTPDQIAQLQAALSARNGQPFDPSTAENGLTPITTPPPANAPPPQSDPGMGKMLLANALAQQSGARGFDPTAQTGAQQIQPSTPAQPDMSKVQPLGGPPQGAQQGPSPQLPGGAPAGPHWANTLAPELRKPLAEAQEQQVAGVQAGAQAQGQQSDEAAKAMQEAREKYQKQLEESQKAAEREQDQLEEHRQQLAQRADDVSKMKVDPNHFYKNQSTAGKISLSIAGALGAFGASLTHGQNYAQDMINRAIDGDINAQEKAIDSAKEGVKTQQSLLADKMRIFDNKDKARAATRQEMLQLSAMQTAQIAEKYKNPQVQAQAQQLIGQLKAQSVAESAKFRPMQQGGSAGLTQAQLAAETQKVFLDSKGSMNPQQARDFVLYSHGQGQAPKDTAGWGPQAKGAADLAGIPSSAQAPDFIASHTPGWVAQRLDPRGYRNKLAADDIHNRATAAVHGSTGLRGEAAQRAADTYTPQFGDTPQFANERLKRLRALSGGKATGEETPEGFRPAGEEE